MQISLAPEGSDFEADAGEPGCEALVTGSSRSPECGARGDLNQNAKLHPATHQGRLGRKPGVCLLLSLRPPACGAPTGSTGPAGRPRRGPTCGGPGRGHLFRITCRLHDLSPLPTRTPPCEPNWWTGQLRAGGERDVLRVPRPEPPARRGGRPVHSVDPRSGARGAASVADGTRATNQHRLGGAGFYQRRRRLTEVAVDRVRRAL